MIKTKAAFIIFTFLSVIIFPYHIVIININSGLFNSIIPGWHTNIISGQIISNLLKFIILSTVTFYYWQLSKVTEEINYQKFLIHFSLTIPVVLFTKINLYDLFHFNSSDPNYFVNQIQVLVYIHIFTNILFLMGQILFWIFYVRFRKNSSLSN